MAPKAKGKQKCVWLGSEGKTQVGDTTLKQWNRQHCFTQQSNSMCQAIISSVSQCFAQ